MISLLKQPSSKILKLGFSIDFLRVSEQTNKGKKNFKRKIWEPRKRTWFLWIALADSPDMASLIVWEKKREIESEKNEDRRLCINESKRQKEYMKTFYKKRKRIYENLWTTSFVSFCYFCWVGKLGWTVCFAVFCNPNGPNQVTE